MADNSRICEQAQDVFFRETGDPLRGEAGEGFALGYAFAQNGDPREPGLGSFQVQAFEQGSRFMAWDAPLGVMISLIERVVRNPGAAGGRVSHQSSSSGVST